MNLLPKISEPPRDDGSILISEFRKQQYSLIEYFMNLIVEYISKQNKNYMTVHSVVIKNNPTYIGGISSSSITKIDVYINVINEPDPKLFFKIIIPTLVDDIFFILNGNYYIPSLYVLDKPIVIKKQSIKLTSLFNPITIYDKLITFMGTNIPANYFVDFLFDSTNAEHTNIKYEMMKEFNITKSTLSEKDIFQYFGNILHCDPHRQEILNKIESIFFDDYTKLLYQYCYNLKPEEINLVNLIKIALSIKNTYEKDMFINLKYKRVIFIEILLAPLFKRIAVYASQAARGYQPNAINMDLLELIKYFRNDLHNKFIYDNVNAYDTMLQHKAYMLNPNVDNPPSVIANLHPSHYQRICPISVSSQHPGETALITAETRIDSFGQFIGL